MVEKQEVAGLWRLVESRHLRLADRYDIKCEGIMRTKNWAEIFPVEENHRINISIIHQHLPSSFPSFYYVQLATL